jgi:predicted nucleic acid-binding Zn ribbon protein
MTRSASGPTSLGEALTAWIAESGLKRRIAFASVVEAWPELVGPQIAAVTRALAITADGTLLVRVATHAWATELTLMTPRILTRVNGSRKERVERIRWTVGPLERS